MDVLERIQQQLVEIFTRCFDVTLGSDDVDLIDTQLLDSLKIVGLVLEIERRFGVSLPFETLEVEDFRTVLRIALLIARACALA